MRNNTFLVAVVAWTVISGAVCTNYFFGEKESGDKLAYRTKVKHEALPLQKRVVSFSYNSTHPIKAIHCYDYQNSEASINITEGGVGYDHVTLRMKSQRSYRLQYALEFYV